jgi:alpha/beta superfamily hydrolase
VVVGGAEHFFHGKLLELRAGVCDFLLDDALARPRGDR